MPRGRKLTTQQIQEAACDRRTGMTWKALSRKYKVAVNTIRFTLSEYSDEFKPIDPPKRSDLERQLHALQSDFANMKAALQKHFDLPLE